jgi:thioredoxin reductase (NADPH)
MNDTLLDVIVIGAGPTGLACAIELARDGYDYAVLDKGCLVNALYHFPPNMVYFTTPELLEVGDLPLVCQGEKPTRLEALKYYRRVAEAYALRVHTYERVTSVVRRDGVFEVATEATAVPGVTGELRHYRSRALIVATGYYDNPNLMGIPGEGLAKVSHYYTEAHPFAGREVIVIGAGNSAAEAALDLFRGGSRVTLVHRGAEPSRSLKYWVAPDLANRIKAGEIRARFETVVEEIRPHSAVLRALPTGERVEIANAFVFALTGYHADLPFIRSMGVEVDPETDKPALDPETLESNVPGLYMAGVAIAGIDNNKVFIENGRFHGKQILRALRRSLPPSGKTVAPPTARTT